MDAYELIKKIENVFDGIKKPETSLRQFKLTDEKGMSCEISDQEWDIARKNRVDSIWQQIPDAEIKECDCLLAHMQAEEFQYYLPAYMRYSLNHYEVSIWKDDVIGSTVFSLYPSKQTYEYNVKQLSLLNTQQRQVCIHFLKFVEENADYIQRPFARKARERYWEK
jgi:hypothetical protein